MKVIYKDSTYPIQPQHISVGALTGIDKDIVQLCKDNVEWISFTAAEIGWSPEKLGVVKGLCQAGHRYYLSADYVRSLFATSPAVDNGQFIDLLERTKMVEMFKPHITEKELINSVNKRSKVKEILTSVYAPLSERESQLEYAPLR